MTARGLAFRDLVLLQVSGSYPLVLTASDLFQAISADNVGFRKAINLGKRWASGELRGPARCRLWPR